MLIYTSIPILTCYLISCIYTSTMKGCGYCHSLNQSVLTLNLGNFSHANEDAVLRRFLKLSAVAWSHPITCNSTHEWAVSYELKYKSCTILINLLIRYVQSICKQKCIILSHSPSQPFPLLLRWRDYTRTYPVCLLIIQTFLIGFNQWLRP